ncbi:hypothetical protein P5G61_00245 [Paenibacillus sp. F6_3S_P_1C]|uniref:Uncharacterized protein n=1 Tax=Paenibacillus vandeheii TaxID=3035917 RepID=A0ABT8J3L7_9BACL|nr:hypothetical protein [Paenibacillus vandeheii]MDN4599640.1 hypothetical protein [Paenibacillus vandeheii]
MRKKRWIKSIVILIVILFMSELVMLFSGKVGILNTTKRVIAGAPHVMVQGQTLSYQGKINFEDIQSVEGYSTSDEGAVLYKAKGTPIPPPWIYVRKENTTFFRYKLPQLPWKL